MPFKLLLLEDDRLFNETLQDFLEEAEYETIGTTNPQEAAEYAFSQKFDLYLFDINLPYENGIDFLYSLRRSGDTTPTIFITSREDKASLIEGFDAGADDYMQKPIDLDELACRIEAVLRRHRKEDIETIDGYRIDWRSKRIYRGDELLDITPKAVELLALLWSANEAIVDKERIKSALWSISESPSDGVIRVYITQLKRIFADRIENVRGAGYRMRRR